MTRKWMLIPLAMLIALLPALGCMEEGAPPDETAAKIASLQAKADANAALITQLQSRVSTVEGRAAGEVTQGELDALAAKVTGLETTIADLEAQIEELEDNNGTDETNGDAVTLETETRWRPEVSASVGWAGTSQEEDNWRTEDWMDYLAVGIEKIEPFPIREADVYSIQVVIMHTGESEEPSDHPINAELLLGLTITPTGKVKVSDYIDIYQVGQPYGVWWYTTVYDHPTEDYCRRIRAESDAFEVDLNPGDKVVINLEFELIYGE